MSPFITEDGEIVPECPTCADLRVELAEAQRVVRARALELARLNGDADLRRREHEQLPKVAEIFEYWRTTCGHPRSRLVRGDGSLDAERFDAILWALTTYGEDVCRLAIYGASVGAPERRGHKYDDLGRYVFKSAESVERYANLGKRLRHES